MKNVLPGSNFVVGRTVTDDSIVYALLTEIWDSETIADQNIWTLFVAENNFIGAEVNIAHIK